ncbi:hypothetical protein [Actinomadura miaoliensis]|uniref:Tetratricopeptide repeat protein n=1 Tax=Actinomadura miaoliensis TaxID=430685 RepID=A0ABP7WWJ4_9ACTN
MTSEVSWPWLLDGSPEERDMRDKLLTMTREPAERFLHSLAERAAAGDPTDIQCHALCLAILDRTAEAVRLWEGLLPVRPHSVAVRLNLAKALVIDRRLDQAVAVLERCRDAMAARPHVLVQVDRRLEDLRGALSREADERRLAELQAEAVRRRVDHGRARPGDRLRLARLLCGLMLSPGGDVTKPEVLAAARAAYAEAPADPNTLEFFAGVLLDCGETAELDGVLRTLERVAPHSPVLEIMRRTTRDDPELTARAEALQRRHEDLIALAWQGAADAEAEIRGRLRWLPDNLELRIALMIAVRSRGDGPAALRMADQMAAELDGEHLMHFYVGQLYWDLRRHARARHQFARALATAGDERDRAAVHEMMRVVGAGEDPGNG